MKRRLSKWISDRFTPTARKRAAILLFWLSLMGWGITQFWLAKDEPPVTMGLSWFAITLTAIDIIATTDVREKTEDESE